MFTSSQSNGWEMTQLLQLHLHPVTIKSQFYTDFLSIFAVSLPSAKRLTISSIFFLTDKTAYVLFMHTLISDK